MKEWKSGSPLSFLLQLGDLVDGFSATTTQGSQKAWELLLGTLREIGSSVAIHHCIGNHELYCFDREGWKGRFALPVMGEGHEQRFYYTFSPHPELVFINLDCYDISVLGPSDETNAVRARDYIKANNPNEDPNSPLNMEGLCKRFVQYNGGIGLQQLMWLDDILSEARR